MDNIRIGTVVSGTLKTEDLLPAFADELRRLDPKNKLLGCTSYYAQNEWKIDWENDKAADLLTDVEDALNFDFAPTHMYFGAADGDGADFGWWPDADFDGCHTEKLTDDRIVDLDCNIVVEVNDHGNITVREIGGDIIWDCV